MEDDCKTKAGTKPENVTSVSFTEDADKKCIFPFRYDKVLYYGCTMLGDKPDVMCATATDSDFNAQELGECNDFCHTQCKSCFLINAFSKRVFVGFLEVFLANKRNCQSKTEG